MKRRLINLTVCLNLLSAIILLVGSAGTVLVYQRAENYSNDSEAYDEGGGSHYPVNPQDTKKYLRDMEQLGGKVNVLTDGLRRWLAGMWYGKALAYIVACLTLALSFGIFYTANHLPSRLKSDGP
jgi:hypothetical protein